ncbi:MAG: zf-HC2 domain-containing protein [Planctomycetota bacterium]
MNYEKESKIEELLNSYLDGELSQREQVEVQRLISRDESAARRLRELERCRLLVSSLPPAEPPAELVSGIKKLLHGRMAGITGGQDDPRLGTLHLFVRHVLAASIIIGLAGLLMIVIYRIVGPQRMTPRTVAVQTAPAVAPKVVSVGAEETVVAEDKAGIGFYSLQLETSNFVAVDAYINKLLGESPWLKFDATKEIPGRSVYRVLCSRGGLETLVFDLAPAWTKFDSTTLVVHTDVGQYVTVESVRPEQITKIVNQDTPDGRIKLAKDFAVFNNIEQLFSAERVLALSDSDYPALTTIPRPALTSGEKRIADIPKDASDRVRVDLTIIVSGHK